MSLVLLPNHYVRLEFTDLPEQRVKKKKKKKTVDRYRQKLQKRLFI